MASKKGTNITDDIELIELCIQGNVTAWNTLYDILSEMRVKIGYLIFAAGGCEADIDDIFSDYSALLFRNNFENFKEFIKSGKPIRAWIYNGLKYQYKTWLNTSVKKSKKFDELENCFSVASSNESILDNIPEILDEFSKTLSNMEMEYLSLSFGEQKSDEEIASISNLSINTIRSRKHAIKEKFKEFLEEHLVY